MSDTVEYEIVSADQGFLRARYRLDGKEMMAMVQWDGVEEIDKALRRTATALAFELRKPPRPTQAVLDALIGTTGYVDVPVGTPPMSDI